MPARDTLRLLNYTAGLLSRKWTLPIVRVLDITTMRHSELSRRLPGIVTQKVLTETLREMERSGLVKRTVYPTVPPQVEYQLTPIGIGLLKLSTTFTEWFEMHGDDIHRCQRSYDRRGKL